MNFYRKNNYKNEAFYKILPDINISLQYLRKNPVWDVYIVRIANKSRNNVVEIIFAKYNTMLYDFRKNIENNNRHQHIYHTPYLYD